MIFKQGQLCNSAYRWGLIAPVTYLYTVSITLTDQRHTLTIQRPCYPTLITSFIWYMEKLGIGGGLITIRPVCRGSVNVTFRVKLPWQRLVFFKSAKTDPRIVEDFTIEQNVLSKGKISGRRAIFTHLSLRQSARLDKKWSTKALFFCPTVARSPIGNL